MRNYYKLKIVRKTEAGLTKRHETHSKNNEQKKSKKVDKNRK